MAIQKWNPWGEIIAMERHLNEGMGTPLITWTNPLSWWRIPNDNMSWLPPMEVYEKKDKVVVRAEIPGMKQDEFDISVDGNVLTIKGEKKAESEVKDKDYYRCELSYGKFSRSIVLPSKVRAEKVEADYDNGILEITLPKAIDTRHKKIAVKAKKVAAK
jgi:HSP20 family protein